MARPAASDDPEFFEARYLIEIVDWDATLHLSMSHPATPPEYRFQGGLMYVRGFEIEGRFLAPAGVREHRARVWLSVLEPEWDFTPKDGEDRGVGSLYDHRHEPDRNYHSATLYVPKDALALSATSLGSAWRYIHIWTSGEDDEQASVTRFTFSRRIYPNLVPWMEERAP